MKKLIFFVLLLIFAALVNPMQAQTNPAQLQREADSLREIVNAKKHVIDSLDLELKDFQDNKKQIDSLRETAKKLSQRSRDLQVESANLVGICKKYSDSINQLEPLFKAQKTKNRELENHKQTVAPLVKRQLSQMANGIDKTWLNMTFAETDINKLREDLALYEAFKEEDRGVGNAYIKLKAFYDDATLYMQGAEVVNSPYVASRVAALVQPLSALAKKEIHSGRRQEAETVYGQMKDYKNTVRYFQEDIIPEVDKILSNIKKKDKKEAWNQVKDYLDTGDGGMIRHYLTKIPWIGTQYNLYIKQLENDPFGKNVARQTIMSIKP